MRLNFSGIIKRTVSLALLIFIAALCCVSFDVSADSFGTGGSIKAAGTSSLSDDLAAFAGTGARESSGDESREQTLAKTNCVSDFFSRVFRKLLPVSGSRDISVSSVHLSQYCLAICVSAGAYLFHLALVRFIHLKDGSK